MPGTRKNRHGYLPADLPPGILAGLLDNRYEGITIVDREGIILYISPSTERYFGLDPQQGLGKHVTEIFPGSRLHVVAKTGKAEIGTIVEVKGQRKIVSRIPILKGGKTVGAVSKIMFRDMDTLMQVSVQVPLFVKRKDRYLQRVQQVEASSYTIEDIIGGSPQAITLRDFIQTASKTSSPVLVTGETGSGKEVVAQAIHHLSPRRAGPFISINCSSIPHSLFESELFGYAPGAFTGAAKMGKLGIIHLAHDGTLFLDEISELPLEMQPKLLRVLQEKALRPVGTTQRVGVDFRLISASNEDLETLVSRGLFREDLFYRVNVLTLRVPPLRERKADIRPLTYHIFHKLKKRMETQVERISAEVLGLFGRYSWKGNVRELENVLERAMNLCAGNTIEMKHIPGPLVAAASREGPTQASRSTFRKLRGEMERQWIMDALTSTKGNKAAAAKLLGIHRTHLYNKLKKYGLETN